MESTLRGQILAAGVTQICPLDVEPEMTELQNIIYDCTKHLLVDHDADLPAVDKLRLDFSRAPQESDWSELIRAVSNSPELKALIEARDVVDTFSDLLEGTPQLFEIIKFRANFPSLTQSQYGWHQDHGTWFITRRKYLAKCVPITLWFSLNGADASNSIEILAGTHGLKLLNHTFVEGQGLFHAITPQNIDSFEMITVECEPGEGIFFHPLTFIGRYRPRANVHATASTFDTSIRKKRPLTRSIRNSD